MMAFLISAGSVKEEIQTAKGVILIREPLL